MSSDESEHTVLVRCASCGKDLEVTSVTCGACCGDKPQPGATVAPSLCSSDEVVEAVEAWQQLARDRPELAMASWRAGALLELLRAATIQTEAAIRADERQLEWGRIYTTLTSGGHEAAACYLEDVADPDWKGSTFPRGCYYTKCEHVCGICKEHPASICADCVTFSLPSWRSDERAEERERCIAAVDGEGQRFPVGTDARTMEIVKARIRAMGPK